MIMKSVSQIAYLRQTANAYKLPYDIVELLYDKCGYEARFFDELANEAGLKS